MAPAKTVCDLLLPAENAVHDKWLLAESVRVVLLPAGSFCFLQRVSRKHNHEESWQKVIYHNQQSWQEAKDC